MKMSRELFFFFACHFLKPLKFVWVYQNGIFLGGDFLTSPTFDCTPGYAPDHINCRLACDLLLNKMI